MSILTYISWISGNHANTINVLRCSVEHINSLILWHYLWSNSWSSNKVSISSLSNCNIFWNVLIISLASNLSSWPHCLSFHRSSNNLFLWFLRLAVKLGANGHHGCRWWLWSFDQAAWIWLWGRSKDLWVISCVDSCADWLSWCSHSRESPWLSCI